MHKKSSILDIGSSNDDTHLRSIQRRRAGTCQPRDNLGVDWMQHDDDGSANTSSRKRPLTQPRDNIGNSCICVPALNIRKPEQTGDNEDNIVTTNPPEECTDEEQVDQCCGDQKTEAKKPNDLGISNIRRPTNDTIKMRKPIMPKDNLNSCCQLMDRPFSKAIIANTEKEFIKVADELKKTQSTPDIDELIKNSTCINEPLNDN